MSDGETIEQMGGWIECQRCCVASHFGCLSAEQRSNLLKQVSLKTGQKQDTVEIGETSVSTPFFRIRPSAQFLRRRMSF